MSKRQRPAAEALPAAPSSLLEMGAAELLSAAACSAALYESPGLRAYLHALRSQLLHMAP